MDLDADTDHQHGQGESLRLHELDIGLMSLKVYLGYPSVVHPSNHSHKSGHLVLFHADLPQSPIPTGMPGDHHPLLPVHDIDIHY